MITNAQKLRLALVLAALVELHEQGDIRAGDVWKHLNPSTKPHRFVHSYDMLRKTLRLAEELGLVRCYDAGNIYLWAILPKGREWLACSST